MLKIDGAVKQPRVLSAVDLARLDADAQVPDVSTIDPKRKGRAVKLAAVLDTAQVQPTAKWLTLHAAKDDFHASVPLDVVRERAVIIFELDGQPLPESAGGPFRFLIADYAACRTAEIDDCANVKFIDRIELTTERGQDNRPQNEEAHAKLHGQ